MARKEIWMKLVTFAVAGRDRLGAVVDKHVVDLNAAYAASLARFHRAVTDCPPD